MPRFDEDRSASYAMGDLSHSICVEYDRNLIWLFTNHGLHALSSPLLGSPNLGAPDTTWPPWR